MNFDFTMPDIESELDFDFENFDLIEIDNLETRYIKPKKSKLTDPKKILYKYAIDLVKELKIEKCSRTFAIISGKFIFGDFIESLIVENNWHVKKLTISTLSPKP